MSSKEIAVALIDKLPAEATLVDIAQQIEMVAGAELNHIRCDARGRAWIDDSNVKVIEVVLDQLGHRFDSRGNPRSVSAPFDGADSRGAGLLSRQPR